MVLSVAMETAATAALWLDHVPRAVVEAQALALALALALAAALALSVLPTTGELIDGVAEPV